VSGMLFIVITFFRRRRASRRAHLLHFPNRQAQTEIHGCWAAVRQASLTYYDNADANGTTQCQGVSIQMRETGDPTAATNPTSSKLQRHMLTPRQRH